ncbi:MAG: SBBP repeat-containing protein [Euryarchaeota archaeon]|nr:SBBP repeat-containing protein [Euryarchaeota archaeon]
MHSLWGGGNGRTLNNASDFVWVQISINVPAGAVGSDHTGTVEVHFTASSHLQSAASGSVGFQGITSWASGPIGAGYDFGYGVAVDGDGNVYITGYHQSGLDFGGGITVADEGSNGVFVAKYNNEGVIQWASGPTGAGSDGGTGVAVDGDGNVYITGSHGEGLDFGGGITIANEVSTGVFVAKYNTNGVIQWASGPTGAGMDDGTGVAVDGDGNVYISGRQGGGLIFGGGITVADEGNMAGVFVAKYSTAGVIQWAKGPSGAGWDQGQGVAVDGDGNVYITGYHGSGLDFGGGITVAAGVSDGIFVAKYNTAGVVQWASGPSSGTGWGQGVGVAVDIDGNVYITGYHDSGLDFGGGITVAADIEYGVFVAKYSTAGVVQWANGPSGAGNDYGNSVIVDGDGNVYITGGHGSGLDFGGGKTIPNDDDDGDGEIGGVFVAKYNTGGVVQWASGPTGEGPDSGKSVAVDGDGNVYITGDHGNGLDFGGGITIAEDDDNPYKTGVFVAKYV